jgi:hypothetical protein
MNKLLNPLLKSWASTSVESLQVNQVRPNFNLIKEVKMKRNAGKRYWYFIEVGDKKYLRHCSNGHRFKTRDELRKALEAAIEDAVKHVGWKTTCIISVGYGSYCKPDEIGSSL